MYLPIHKYISLFLIISLFMSSLVIPAQAADSSYADQLLDGHMYSWYQEAAIRGGVEAMPENIMHFLMDAGMAVNTEDDCVGAPHSENCCGATDKTTIYLYDNAIDKSMVHEMAHVYHYVSGLRMGLMLERYREDLEDELDKHTFDDEREFWANCFAYYVMDYQGKRHVIEEKAPAVVPLIEEVLATGGELLERGNMSNLEVFADVAKTKWYNGPINEAALRGLMGGRSVNTFDPDGIATRAEAIKGVTSMISKADAVNQDLPYDVRSDTWYTESVKWVVKNGGIREEWKTHFSPDTPITREEMILAVYRIAGWTSKEYAEDLSQFPDADQISPDCLIAMQWAVANGIIVGTDQGLLNPQSTLTRAELATMIIHMIHQMEQHNPAFTPHDCMRCA